MLYGGSITNIIISNNNNSIYANLLNILSKKFKICWGVGLYLINDNSVYLVSVQSVKVLKHFFFKGQATDIQIQAEEILKLKKQINQLYVRHTGQDLATIEKNMERDKFMSPDEAKSFGIIDKVLTRPPKGKVVSEEAAEEKPAS